MHIECMGNDKYISLAGSEGLYKQIIIKQIGKVGRSQTVKDPKYHAKYFGLHPINNRGD